MATALQGDHEELTLYTELLTQLSELPCPYRASGDAKASFEFLEDGVSMVTKGLVLDGVFDIGSDFWGKPMTADLLKDAMSVCQRCPQTFARYQAELANVLILTLAGNRKASPSTENFHEKAVYNSIKFMTTGRLFLVTSRGLLGLGPRGIRVNDRVCIIAGCHVPMILRRVKKPGQPGCESEEPVNITHEDTEYYHVVRPACESQNFWQMTCIGKSVMLT
jgi:hypothetical protein